MTAVEVHAIAEELGVKLTVANGKLRVDAPIGVLTEELKAALAENKAGLLALLRGPPPCPDPSAPASQFGRWLSDLTAFNEATGRLRPLRPWPWPEAPRDFAAEAEHGDRLRAHGLALPLCWLPGEDRNVVAF
jgi:hypothetical protein